MPGAFPCGRALATVILLIGSLPACCKSERCPICLICAGHSRSTATSGQPPALPNCCCKANELKSEIRNPKSEFWNCCRRCPKRGRQVPSPAFVPGEDSK